MLALQILAALILLTVCSFAPGFFFVRRLPWNPLEKLCGSVALSLVLVYLAAWEYYCLAPNSETAGYWVVSLVCLTLGIIARKDALVLIRNFRVRQALTGYGFLLLWSLVILSMIRVYSGAKWNGDWMEHFQRSLFFLHRFPVDTPIIGGYTLSARPPLMNVLTAFFMVQTQDRFEIFQVVFTFLNILMFLPCCLILPALGGRKHSNLIPLVALIALNPVAMEAATYGWTRGLTTFFILTGTALYLSGWRKRDPLRTTAAFTALSAGLLVHYSAGPYAVFLGLHYLIHVFPRRTSGRWRELGSLLLASTLLLATWFGWSLATFGPHTTFASNTTIVASQSYAGSTPLRIAANIYHSLVPPVLREPALMETFDQANRLAKLRDQFFITVESNVLLSIGLAAGPLALWLLYCSRRRSPRPPEQNFWFALIPFCIILGIAVVGEADKFGVAHATLLSLAVLGLVLVASAFPLRPMVMTLLLLGCAVDFSLGILLHARVQSFENGPGPSYFAIPFLNSAGDLRVNPPPDAPSMIIWGNWSEKHQYSLTRQWLALAPRNQPLSSSLRQAVEKDQTHWHGWFSRNGGSMTYIGDHFAGLSFDGIGLLPELLLVLLAGLLWKLRDQWDPNP